MTPRIRVAMAGATGRTGREVVRACYQAPDLLVVAALGRDRVGEHLGQAVGEPGLDLVIAGSMAEAAAVSPDVLIDFTEPVSAFPRLMAAVEYGWSIVVGTTGFSREQRTELAARVRERQVGAAVIANFSVGAWVTEHLAEEAARFFQSAEVIEEHHAAKRDRPSGTARRMADLLGRVWGRTPDDIPVHSLRLPGLVAHQTVVFGSSGQVLSIRHDVHDRTAYADGVLAAVRKVQALRGEVIESLGEVLS